MQRSQQDYLVLIHGLGRTSFSMRKPARFFAAKGYHVLNFGYPSTRLAIAASAERLDQFVTQNWLDSTKRIHFLSHSLGGIVLRAYLKQLDQNRQNSGRAVMLAPPNQGSELADKLRNFRLYKWCLGQAGQQLGTDSMSVPLQLGAVDFEVGVIAANRSVYPLSSLIFGAANDGLVAVDRTKVEGMKDFLIVPQVHTFVMNSEAVLHQANHFLQNGCFKI